ncbi:hypothetical protein GCM10011402_04190 [Paracoccus acridae]|uniref:Uncharacterized protein n=1 Tax=Paracoccus acridae TaxID=1795310 RepID=A0ABQ1VCW4_9RHOB|nr:hypothetical protein [Paracoccus acridae]GGF55381.1 hypothetical protein GCM10011402_04190 [Paracoccus acridae]
MIRLAAALMLLSGAAQAQQVEVTPCGDADRVDTIAEPWDQNTATYANGDVRVALLDMVEPAGGAWKLAVISPPRDELGLRQCRVIGADGIGFYGLDFASRRADYDRQRGLVLTFPATRYADAAPEGEPYRLVVTINQQTGEIATEVQE